MSNIAVVNILSLITFLFNDYGICVPESQLARYWQHVRAFEPWGVNHPASASASHIPMAIYGDECRYTSSSGLIEQVIVISLSIVLFCPRSTRASRFPIVALRASECLGPRTLHPILRYIRWACNILYTGCLPLQGFEGYTLPPGLQGVTGYEPLCQGLRFCVTEFRGDWSWHYYIFGFRNRWTSKNLCWRCQATAVRQEAATLRDSYLDFSDSATWRSTELSHTSFICNMLQDPICRLDCAFSVFLFLESHEI